ncbi:acid phosphatase [Burkholderiaceae bacterium UC74_6]
MVEKVVDIERRQLLKGLAATGAGVSLLGGVPVEAATVQGDAKLREKIKTVVVIYAENRSFNNLFHDFPGLQRPLASLKPADYIQYDRDGKTPLKSLPAIWGGLVPQSQTVEGKRYFIDEKAVTGLANKPFALKDGQGQTLPMTVVTRDLTHRFYNNQAQIAAGRCNQFVAWGDSGALVMGHYGQAGEELKLRRIAARYTLCDNFFMAAFGGSFLNHIFLVAAAPPFYPDAANSPAKHKISKIEGDDPTGTRLKLAEDNPASCLDGPPKYEHDSMLTPDGYCVNSAAPAYQPSYVKPAAGGDKRFANPDDSSVLPPQTYATIGDRLSDKGVSWAWYGGAWQAALDNAHEKGFPPVPNFQSHHQPFNFFASFAPDTKAREQHLLDGGLGSTPDTNKFIADIDAGRLPAVSFYKPQGNLNLHAGYADVASGDAHLATVIEHLEKSPQWANMLVVLTFDENGGWWDHVSPPLGDRWGPGTRIPALVISPHAKKGHVDHTVCDTNSILRFITRLHGLEPLPGVKRRDQAMAARGQKLMGDLTHALNVG